MCVILGFPVALLLAWAFELTPEGIKTTKVAQTTGADAEEHSSHTKKRNWIAFAMGAVIPAVIFGTLALFFYIRSGGRVEFSSEDKSIAVLPFDNRSNREEDIFFTDGVHDDLLTLISKIGDIRTVARTSVMAYQNTTESMKTIGEELNVSTLLEGGVQRSGNQIRINVKLFDAATEAQLWAETYTRDLIAENVFKIQTEISLAIADALHAVLSPEEKDRMEKFPTENLAALEAYFKGKESTEKRSRSGWEEAIKHFEKAISLDRNFALAHAFLGRSILLHTPYSGLPVDDATAKAKPHILQALALDNTLSEAYLALGILRRDQGDPEAAEVAYRKAIELNSNSVEAYHYYASFLRGWIGGTKKVASLYRRAYELDPKSNLALYRLALSFEALGQWKEALKAIKQRVAENPESAAAYRGLGYFCSRHGPYDDAIVANRKQLALDPTAQNVKLALSRSYGSLGDTKQALWWLDRYLETQQDPLLWAEWKGWKSKLTGHDETIEQSALEGLKLYPKNEKLIGHLTDLYIASGRPEKVRSPWEQAYPALFEPSPAVEWNNVSEAKEVARVLMATGEREQATRLIKEAMAAVRSQVPDLNVLGLEADLHAIAGENRKALNAIRRYLDAGGSPYNLELRDTLKSLLDNPEYQTMAEKRKAELAIQLKRINEMEANGELAPIPDLPAN